jgi:hypothetical protein
MREDNCSREFLRERLRHMTLSFLFSIISTLHLCAAIDFGKIEKSIVTIYQVDLSSNVVAQGTGFFIDSVTVVTNFHVVFDTKHSLGMHGTKGVRIELNSGEIVYPYHVAFDSIRDVAVLHLETKLKQKYFLPIAKKKPKVGDIVWTIGNPQGLSNSWSNGIVSSIRAVGESDTVFQFTAAISPGSSGGPVLNDVGQVVGISTFKVKDGENLNFFVEIAAAVKAKGYYLFWLKDEDFKKGNTVSNFIELAKAATDKGDYTVALNYLNEASKIDTSDSEIFKAKAENFLGLNDLRKAEETILKAEESNHFMKGLDFEISKLWGMLHEKQGRFKQAARDFLNWSENFSIYTKEDDVLLQWGYLKAANCFYEAEEYSKAKYYIGKVTDQNYMDFSFYKLRSIIYMRLAKDGDNTITQNMLCSDLMKVKNILETGSDFESYKKAKQIFDQICR